MQIINGWHRLICSDIHTRQQIPPELGLARQHLELHRHFTSDWTGQTLTI